MSVLLMNIDVDQILRRKSESSNITTSLSRDGIRSTYDYLKGRECVPEAEEAVVTKQYVMMLLMIRLDVSDGSMVTRGPTLLWGVN